MKSEYKNKIPTLIERGKGIMFSRIRRITGYLVGDLSTWNNSKRAEEKDRVIHM